jgi:NAD(P)-dependent dehydrogenase (short-subunit alcohol dehydrogenase family)
MSASDRYAGKVAIVTGGANGIGAAVTQHLARGGARVVVGDLDGDAAVKQATSLGGDDQAVGVEADVATEKGVGALLQAALDNFGTLDLVHANAGITGPAKNLIDFDVDDFDRVFAVNARGAFLTVREAMRYFAKEGKPGAIVNTASTAGVRGYRMRVAYATSKHGVVGLTRVAALEGAPLGVRVNAICPGPTETQFITSVAKEWGDGDIDKGRAEMSQSVPLARLGTTDEIAALVAWLLSDEASYVTGAIVPADGGRTAY